MTFAAIRSAIAFRLAGQPVGHALALTACVVLLYILGAEASRAFSDLLAVQDYWAWWIPFWLPAGISFAAVLRCGPAALPGVFIGSMIINLYLGGGPLVSTWISLINVLQPLAGAWLVARRCPPEELFSSVRNVFHFLFVTTLVTVPTSAPLGTLGIFVAWDLASSSFALDTLRWALGDITAILLLTPLLQLMLAPGLRARLAVSWEAVALLATAAAVSVIVFGGWLAPPGVTDMPLAFLIFPIVAWAALRHSLMFSSLLILLITFVATVATAVGVGPFGSAVASAAALLLLQCLIAALSLTGLLLCAATAERLQYQSRLSETLQSLDSLVKARTVALDTANHQLALEAAGHELSARINEGRSRLMERLTTGEPLSALLESLEAEMARIAPHWTARIALAGQAARAADLREVREPVLAADGTELAEIFVWTPEGAVLTENERRFLRDSGQLVRVIVEHKRNEEKLHRLARHDSLTGALNRGAFADNLTRALTRGTDTREALTLLYIDIDGFKALNDSHGHAEGDRLLVEIAARFRTLVGDQGFLGRVGGDEFVIALPGMARREMIALLAGRLVECCSAFAACEDRSLPAIAASVGIATHPQNGSTGEALMQAADAAMYEAKRSGGSRYVFAAAIAEPTAQAG